MSSAEGETLVAVDTLSGDALARVLGRAVSRYATLAGSGAAPQAPFTSEETPSPTDVATTVCAMLEQVGIEVFELGLWAAWGGGSSPGTQEGG